MSSTNACGFGTNYDLLSERGAINYTCSFYSCCYCHQSVDDGFNSLLFTKRYSPLDISNIGNFQRLDMSVGLERTCGAFNL